MTFSPICRPWDGNTSTSPAITSGHPICRKPSTDCEPCAPPPPTFAKLPNVLVLSAYATISHEPLVPAKQRRPRHELRLSGWNAVKTLRQPAIHIECHGGEGEGGNRPLVQRHRVPAQALKIIGR